MKSKRNSKTISAAAVTAMVGVLEVKFHLLEGVLGEWYGIGYILVGMLFAYLRTITSEPVE